MRMTRRMATTGVLGGFTALTALLSTPLAAQSKEARLCLTVLYPWQSDARFDFQYYRDKHLGMMRELYGNSVGKMEVRKGVRKGDGSPPAFIATAMARAASSAFTL